ncbi:PorT family protein [Litoribacter ruber]|uniref:PorT family protein n=1 Tax=Litoribacter ruber TaxID=702568 RepID=A0AAP2G4Q3_9BACT|nr:MULTISPECIES: porin family protein [Litoribacter]MBS9523703.1 PorT family protein [Litoribacter alkaliphilus]MBT0812217.1 PorT family protein [Litoribacter ruber]
MKKLLIAAFCLFFAASTQAQDFSIGPKVGVSQGNISVNGDGYSSGSNRLGYHLGGFVRLGGRSFFIQPEVLYTNTGGEIEQTSGPGGPVSYEATFNRLDVPVMLGLKFGNVFRVQAGPVASFLLSSSFDGNGVEYNNNTIGYQAGIGLDIANLILDLKYEGPLGNTSDSVAGFPTDQRMNQLILSLGIRLF